MVLLKGHLLESVSVYPDSTCGLWGLGEEENIGNIGKKAKGNEEHIYFWGPWGIHH